MLQGTYVGFAKVADSRVWLTWTGISSKSGLLSSRREGMGARTRNMHLASAIAFANWCLQADNGRLLNNPFAGIAKADEKSGCRRKRRALFEHKLVELLEMARRRPLLDAMTIRRGVNKGKPLAKVSNENRHGSMSPDISERLIAS